MPLPKPIAKVIDVLKEPSVYVPILLVLLVVVLSVGGYFLLGSWLVSVIVALAVALIIVMVIMLRTVFGEEKERQLERGIDDIGAPGESSDRLQVDQMGVEESFARAIRDIRSSRLGSGSLSDLPWFAVIGETGSGKTELLRHSGLTLPAEFAHRVGSGPTASCDWWLANEAIGLDTAGRLLDSEDAQSRADWENLIRLVKRARSADALNGLIVTIPVTSLLGKSESEIEGQALALRRRINQMEDILGLLVPVYVVVTKADLIEGFVETVRGLTPSQPSEAFGWTNDRPRFADAGELVTNGLGELRDRLEKLVPDLVLREPDPRARRRIFTFPQELDEAIRAVARFVGRSFAPSAYDEVPFLRGVYFTSALRQGTTVSPLLHRLGQDWARNTVDGACADGGLFVRELFSEIVIGDRDLAVPRTSVGPRLRRLVHVTMGLAFTVMVGWWGISAVQNWSGVRGLRSDAAQAIAGPSDLSHLDALRRNINTQVEEMTVMRGAGLAGPMWDAIEDARSAFVWAFGREFEKPTKRRLESAVTGRGDRGFEALAQLAQDVTWMAARADEEKATRPDLSVYAPISQSETEVAAFRQGYDDYLRWAEHADLQLRIDTERDAVKSKANQRLVISELESWSKRRAKDYPAARYADVGLRSASGEESTQVPGAYTRRGWEGLVSGLVSSIGDAEGKASPRVVEFRRGYIDRFDRSWRSYLLEAPMRAVADSDVTDSPYLGLVDQIRTNTAVELPREEALPAWIAMVQSVRDEEVPPPPEGEPPVEADWTRYRAALSQVEADVARAAEKGDAALQTSIKMADDQDTSFKAARELVREIVPTEGDPEAASKLREIMTMPISNGASAVLDRALAELDQRWRDRIAQPYAAHLDTPKMQSLYAPGEGDLSSFTSEALGRFYADGRSKDVFQGRSMPFGPRFLRWMRQAESLQRTLYASGFGARPSLGARLEGIPSRIVGRTSYTVSRRELRLSCEEGEQTFLYREGAGSGSFRWTPDCNELSLRVWALDRHGSEVELLPKRQWNGPLAFPGFLQQAQRLSGRRLQWSFKYLEPSLELVIQYRMKGGEAILALEHSAPPGSLRN
ncbi:MAG: type VI secretion protein IcmF/TssM N-terminal domain-containing protein [Myxococcota bacterium]